MSNYQKWAEFRFAVIAELLASPPERGELSQRLDELCQKTWKDPVKGLSLRVSRTSIERWYYKARGADSPVGALCAKKRADGQTPSLTSAMMAELERSYREFPRWSTKLHYDNFNVWLVQNQLPRASYASVRRLFRRRGWRRVKRIEAKEVRSFENPYVGGLWHLDFHHGRRLVLTPEGKRTVPICLCIMDDCSRVVCHIQWFLHENAKALVHGFAQACLKRGLPRALLTDNGSAMLSEEFTQGLKRLGIHHETTLPYSPHQNGKQESFWGNVEGRLMSLLEKEDLSLEKLNQVSIAWAEMEYNRRTHSEIKMPPLEKWQLIRSVLRHPPGPGDLRKLFRREVERKVRMTDGTFLLDAVRFEVPLQYRALEKVFLHYAKWDLSLVDLVDPKTKARLAPVYPVDLAKNASRPRRTIEPSIEPLAPAQTPRLLEKYIQDYSAEGRTVGYIPLEEEK